MFTLIPISGPDDAIYKIVMLCNYRQCCDVRPLYACAYSGLRYTIAIIEGNDLCSFLSHAQPVPRDTAGVCAMCSILIMDVIILFPIRIRVYM